MSARGAFIVVEGPNGVGKTTSAAALADHLNTVGTATLLTSEPSKGPIGTVARAAEAALTGRVMALAIAADRAWHLSEVIEPALAAGRHVISDRYLPSSLVLQRLDGLDIDEIWTYNAFALPADLTFYLETDPQIIDARLNERLHKSRLERVGSPGLELDLYDQAHEFLAARGWRQIRIDCREKTPAELVAEMLHHLELPMD
ncbi:dTMP kinase [Herbidospora sp. RD11066]